MMYRPGVSGLMDRVKDRPRKQVAIVGIAVIAALILLVVGVQQLGSSGEGADGEDSGLAGPLPGEVGYVDMVLVENLVLEQVSATVAALEPTATPEPTPDVAATIQARLKSGRDGLSIDVTKGVLESGVARNPYLRKVDRKHLEELGEELWRAVVVYLRLAEVSGLEFNDLSWTFVEERVEVVDGVFGEGVDDWLKETPDEGDGLDPAVKEYAESVWDAMNGVKEAGLALREMHDLFRESGVEYVVEMSTEDRAAVQSLYLSIGGRLRVFDEVLSRYGCSVCGELIRVVLEE